MTDFITDPELAEYVGTPDVQDTGLLQAAIAAACQQVRDHCQRSFELATTTASARVFAVDDPLRVWVDDFATTTDLVVTTDENDDGAYEVTWSASDYELGPFNATVYEYVNAANVRTFPTVTRRRGVVRITARWGWPEVPAPVKQAALELAKDAYSARLNRGGVIVTDVGAVSVRTNRLAAAWLAPYVRMDRSGIA